MLTCGSDRKYEYLHTFMSISIKIHLNLEQIDGKRENVRTVHSYMLYVVWKVHDVDIYLQLVIGIGIGGIAHFS